MQDNKGIQERIFFLKKLTWRCKEHSNCIGFLPCIWIEWWLLSKDRVQIHLSKCRSYTKELKPIITAKTWKWKDCQLSTSKIKCRK